ncbi:PspC domain-containing protein [Pontibacillus salicampi]|uniref:PspC domain-containing protein n=1 Tax=Pontibacillus salicampi TaxID=1449801 RepID=A0ABV6LJY8_9BACI
MKEKGEDGLKMKVCKARKDRAISGVCGGIAAYFGISSFAIRLLFIFLPGNIILYLLLTYIMPDASPSLLIKEVKLVVNKITRRHIKRDVEASLFLLIYLVLVFNVTSILFLVALEYGHTWWA